MECTNPRKIDRTNIPDVPPEAAWEELVAGSNDGDLDDVKAAFEKYVKAIPGEQYPSSSVISRANSIHRYHLCSTRGGLQIPELTHILDRH